MTFCSYRLPFMYSVYTSPPVMYSDPPMMVSTVNRCSVSVALVYQAYLAIINTLVCVFVLRVDPVLHRKAIKYTPALLLYHLPRFPFLAPGSWLLLIADCWLNILVLVYVTSCVFRCYWYVMYLYTYPSYGWYVCSYYNVHTPAACSLSLSLSASLLGYKSIVYCCTCVCILYCGTCVCILYSILCRSCMVFTVFYVVWVGCTVLICLSSRTGITHFHRDFHWLLRSLMIHRQIP